MESSTTYFAKVLARMGINIPEQVATIVKDMAVKADDYTPEDTRNTRNGMKVDVAKQCVTWENEYVEYIYWGVGIKFKKVKNPKAQAMWADRAGNENIDRWATDYADAIVKSF